MPELRRQHCLPFDYADLANSDRFHSVFCSHIIDDQEKNVNLLDWTMNHRTGCRRAIGAYGDGLGYGRGKAITAYAQVATPS
jgi:hypothetical protein